MSLISMEKTENFLNDLNTFFEEQLQCSPLPDGFVERQEGDMPGTLALLDKMAPDLVENVEEAMTIALVDATEEVVITYLKENGFYTDERKEAFENASYKGHFTKDDDENCIHITLKSAANYNIAFCPSDLRDKRITKTLLERLLVDVKNDMNGAA